ncbi:hypothetical protein BGAL_0051g00150 [Botrytis galanthina]|uniref:Uncharacterized protein n=1 Tax=Botrytis galanthina TaxID=278940 RepID=A0A4S8R6B9_9HELO|nr:hypothetical protein BGAL_0051g00150 [Botrytis galanthina]
MVSDELIDHVQKKLEDKDARLVTKCFTSMEGFLDWELDPSRGRIPAPLADVELELNDMSKKYQEDYDVFVKTFYERLEIKKQGGEFATKESYEKLGSLEFIWEMEESRMFFKDNREKICEEAWNVTDKMEKGLSTPERRVEEYCEKTFSETVAAEER